MSQKVKSSPAGPLVSTEEIPHIADGIAAVPRPVSSCHKGTHAVQQNVDTTRSAVEVSCADPPLGDHPIAAQPEGGELWALGIE
jgi:hypothetical protein